MKNVIGIILLALLTSCHSTKMSTNNNHVDETWELITVNGEEVSSEKPLTLTLNEKKEMFGFFGCNYINGVYHITNQSNIGFSNIASTLKMCEENEMSTEREILEALEHSEDIKMLDDELIIRYNNNRYIFNRIENKEVVGKYWKLIELNQQKVSFKEDQEREIYMVLRSDNHFYGFAGCNYMNGSYMISKENKIAFKDDIATTMMACPNTDENAFLDIFKNIDHYKVSADKLYVYDGDMVLAVFESVLF